METSDWITLAGIVAILAFLWNLHRDTGDLRERMARLEGLFDGFTRHPSPATNKTSELDGIEAAAAGA